MPSAQMESVHTLARHVLDEMGKVIVGQESLKRQCLVVLLCEGHALIEGAPGLAKTLAVRPSRRYSGSSTSACSVRPT